MQQSVQAILATIERIPEEPSDIGHILVEIQKANYNQVMSYMYAGDIIPYAFVCVCVYVCVCNVHSWMTCL